MFVRSIGIPGWRLRFSQAKAALDESTYTEDAGFTTLA